MHKNKFKKGFTLIELLVVVAIISMLSSVIIGSLNEARAKARDQALIQSVKQTQAALELYYNKYGEYPDNSPGNKTPNYYTSHLYNTGVWVGRGGSPTQYTPNRLIDRLKADKFLSEIKPQNKTLLYYSYFNGEDSSTVARMKCDDGSSDSPKYLIGFIPENTETADQFPRILYSSVAGVAPYAHPNYYIYNCLTVN